MPDKEQIICDTYKTQECEELKKQLKELKKQYKLSCLNCEYKNTKADVARYRKALEEIEACCNKYKTCRIILKENILDIIRKAKGEGNNAG